MKNSWKRLDSFELNTINYHKQEEVVDKSSSAREPTDAIDDKETSSPLKKNHQ